MNGSLIFGAILGLAVMIWIFINKKKKENKTDEKRS